MAPATITNTTSAVISPTSSTVPITSQATPTSTAVAAHSLGTGAMAGVSLSGSISLLATGGIILYFTRRNKQKERDENAQEKGSCGANGISEASGGERRMTYIKAELEVSRPGERSVTTLAHKIEGDRPRD